MRHLELVERLAEHGSLRRAAGALGISQPAASELVRDLEQVFGVPLYQRTARGLRPLGSAVLLLERARIALRELDRAQDALMAADGTPARHLRVGAVSHAVHNVLPLAVGSLARSEPELRVRIREAAIHELLPLLQKGELDCVIGRLSPDYFSSGTPSRLLFWHLGPEPIVLVAPTGHPLARRRRLDLAALAGAQWVLLPPEVLTSRLFSQAFLRAGLAPPRACIVSDSMASNLALAVGASMLTLATVRAARRMQVLGLVRILNVRLDLGMPPLAFICRDSSAGDIPIAALREALLALSGPANERRN